MAFPESNATFLPRFGDLPENYELPEKIELTDSEKQQAIDFEHELFGLTVNPLGRETTTVGEILTHEEIPSGSLATSIFIEYFLCNCGRRVNIDIEDEERDIELPEFQNGDEVVDWFASRALDREAHQTLAALAKNSKNYFKEQFKKDYRGESVPDNYDEAKYVNLAPAVTTNDLVKLLAARSSLKGAWRSLKPTRDQNPNIFEARKAWLEIYTAKVNNSIAGCLPRVVAVIEQSKAVPEGYESFLSDIEAVTSPTLLSVMNLDSGLPFKERLLTRLDYLRNGIARQPSELGKQVDAKLAEIKEVGNETNSELGEGILSEEEIRILKETKLAPEQIRTLIGKLLDVSGKSEKGWKAILNPNKNTFSVKGSVQEFRSVTSERTLFDVLTVGMVHEFGHVMQEDNALALSVVYKFAGIRNKGKRSTGMREEAAKELEYQAEEILVGPQIRRPRLTYAKALGVLDAGGSVRQAARAFAEESSKSGDAAAEEAADRIARLISYGGVNSQPMVYAEAFMLNQTLPMIQQRYPEVSSVVTEFDIPDQLRLARVGMMPEGLDRMDVRQQLMLAFDILSQFNDVGIDWKEKKEKLASV